jgi:hypothetical protein
MFHSTDQLCEGLKQIEARNDAPDLCSDEIMSLLTHLENLTDVQDWLLTQRCRMRSLRMELECKLMKFCAEAEDKRIQTLNELTLVRGELARLQNEAVQEADPLETLPALVTVPAMVRAFGVDRKTVMEWIEKDGLPARQDATGKWKVKKKSLKTWAQETGRLNGKGMEDADA